MRLSLRASVAAALGVGLLLLVAVSAVSYRSLTGFLETEEWVRHAHEILDTSHRLFIALEDMESGHRGYALSGDERYLPTLPVLRASVPPLLARLRLITTDNPRQAERRNSLEALVEAKLRWNAEIALRRRTEGLASAAALFDTNRGKLLMDKIVRLMREIEDEEDVLLAARLDLSRGDARRTARAVILMTFAGMLLTLLWAAAIDRSIRQAEKAENSLRESGESMRLVNKELEAFSYSVSHDLRAPLRAIDGFSQAVLEDSAGALSAESAADLARVRAASQRMARLIDDMLKLAHVSRVVMRPSRVDMSAMAEAELKELASAEPGRRVTIAVQPGLTADGDEGLVRLVMANLLGNAWKFTSRTPEARIEFSAVLQPGAPPAYRVRDNGAGFDPVYAGKLFGAFQRLHTEAEFPGTGVGLATVLRVVNRHGGRAWAESSVGKGASFYFTLAKKTGGSA